MNKRDDFLQKVANLNNQAYIDTQILILESYVDKEMSKDDNIIAFINSNISGYDTSGNAYTDGIVNSNTYVVTNAIHKNPDVKSSSNTKSGNYTIWGSNSSDLILNGMVANTTSWLDKTLDNKIYSTLTIQLPDNTNKNVALALAEKYKSTKLGTDGNPIGGFWSYIPTPQTAGSVNNTSYPDAVTIKQTGNTLFIVFKLYPNP